jgi:hypothetical protein
LAFGFYGSPARHARHCASEQMGDGKGSGPVVAAAARALGSFDDHGQVPLLDAGLGSSDPDVSRRSFLSIARLAQAGDLPRLEAAAAGDSDREAVVAVTRARLAALAASDMRGFLKATLSHAAFYEDLVGVAKFAVKDLDALCTTDGALDDAARARCFRVLGLARLRPRGVMGSAFRLAFTQDAPRFLRLESVRYLGRARAPVAERLCNLLEEPDRELVRSTVIALGEIADGVAIGPVLNVYDAFDGALQADVELAAWRMCQPLDDAGYDAWAAGDRDLTPHSVYFFSGGLKLELQEPELRDLLTHGDTLVAREAALLLGISGTATSLEALSRLANAPVDERTLRVASHAALLAGSREPPP